MSTETSRTEALKIALGCNSSFETKLPLAKAFDAYIADDVDFDLSAILVPAPVKAAQAPITSEEAPEATQAPENTINASTEQETPVNA